MDCFAEPVIGRRFAPTRWLAMTWIHFGFNLEHRIHVRVLAAGLPEVCLSLSLEMREQGMPDARCTRGLVCEVVQKKLHTSIQGSGEHPTFPAQWLDGL